MASSTVTDRLDAVERKPLKASLNPLQKVSSDAGRLVMRALDRAGIAQKEAAATMGISESLLARQLAGTEHLSWQRLSLLPDRFKQELAVALAEASGASVETTVIVRRVV